MHKNKTPLCIRHYQQAWVHGKPLKRTKYDKNLIIAKGNICEMELYNLKGKVIAKTIFNHDHYGKVIKFKWCLTGMGYAFNVVNNLFLHHLIKGRKDGYDMDHKDGDRLNNLDSNLRQIKHKHNCWNKKVKGYYWEDARKSFYTRIAVNKKTIFLGRFKTEQEAIKARKEAEKKYYGEYAPVY